jgi:lipid-A-disaccharide synthase-like uncharacterized protein
LERDFGVEVAKAFTAARPNWAFRVCNVTSWTSFLWLVLGLVGQGAFSARMLIQWAVSEKKKQSTVPPLFWWLSLLGAMALFAYFTWRQDLVGVLGQAPGVVIYARNLRLIAKARRRALREPLGARA